MSLTLLMSGVEKHALCFLIVAFHVSNVHKVAVIDCNPSHEEVGGY